MKSCFPRSAFLWLMALSAFVLAGCSDVERAPAPAQPDRPAPGKALVIFYRPNQEVGGGRGVEISDSGKPIGSLCGGAYFVFQAGPGEHCLAPNGHDEKSIIQKFEANRTYYIRCMVEMGNWLPHYTLACVAADDARAAIGNLERVRWVYGSDAGD